MRRTSEDIKGQIVKVFKSIKAREIFLRKPLFRKDLYSAS
jgi:hypothetical protein